MTTEDVTVNVVTQYVDAVVGAANSNAGAATALGDNSDGTYVNGLAASFSATAEVGFGNLVGTDDVASFVLIVRCSSGDATAEAFANSFTGISTADTSGFYTAGSQIPQDVVLGPFTKSGGGTWTVAEFNSMTCFLGIFNGNGVTPYRIYKVTARATFAESVSGGGTVDSASGEIGLVVHVGDQAVTRAVRDLTFRKVVPGGYASVTVDLDRPLAAFSPDLQAYTKVRVTDARHGGTVIEGYLEDPGRANDASGGRYSLAAVGPMAFFNNVFPHVFCDSSEDSWDNGETLNASGSPVPLQISTATKEEGLVGSGGPAIVHQVQANYTDAGSRFGSEYRRPTETGQFVGSIRMTHRESFAHPFYDLVVRVGGSTVSTHNDAVPGDRSFNLRQGVNWSSDSSLLDYRWLRDTAYEAPSEKILPNSVTGFVSEESPQPSNATVLSRISDGSDVTALSRDGTGTPPYADVGFALPAGAYDRRIASFRLYARGETNSSARTRAYASNFAGLVNPPTAPAYSDGVSYTTSNVQSAVVDFEIGPLTRAGGGTWSLAEFDAMTCRVGLEHNDTAPALAHYWLLYDVWCVVTFEQDVDRQFSHGDIFVKPRLRDLSGGLYTSTNTAATDAAEVISDILGTPGWVSLVDAPNAILAPNVNAIPHLTYPEGVAPTRVLDDLARIEPDRYWYVGETTSTGLHRFEWAAWPTAIRYEASVADGFDSPGSTADVFNRVLVRYTDAGGVLRTVTRTSTVPNLEAVGIVRATVLNLPEGTANTAATAEVAGDAFLAEHAFPVNGGTLRISRPILDRIRGRMVQPHEIEPGTLVRLRDGAVPGANSINSPTRDGATVFRIVAMDYRLSSNTAELSLDSYARTTSQGLAALATGRNQ